MGMPRKLACEGFCQKPPLLNYKFLRVLDVTPPLYRPSTERDTREPNAMALDSDTPEMARWCN